MARGRLSGVSYDLIIAEKRDGEDWEAVLARLENGAAATETLSAERREFWGGVADRLLGLGPGFERFDGPAFVEVSQGEWGLQVSLYEHEGAVSVPYWHQGDAAREVMELVARAIDVVCEDSGWSVWDPQLERQLDSGSALLDGGPQAMSGIAERLPEMLGTHKRPWWRFWAR